MATSKALRAAPDRKLSDYVASIKRLFDDPVTVSDDKFIKQNYIITFNSTVTVGGLSPWQGYSSVLPIGFDFKVNGVTYKEFIVQASGWMMLKDPAGGTSGATFWIDVLDSTDPEAANYNNSIIRAAGGEYFDYNHILLAPYFSTSRLVTQTVDELQTASGGYGATITSTVEANILNGSDTRNWPYDLKDYGVRYVNGFDSKKGKYLLVRWTTTSVDHLLKKFEVAIFENGTIEYRYWPQKVYEKPSSYLSSADGTIGIFWSSLNNGTNNFRDLSPLLDYKKSERTLSQLGGVQGSDGLIENSNQFYEPTNRYYAINVDYNTYWPRNGAVITLSPPVTSGKFLPKKIIGEIASTRPVVRSPNAYDDRKTIPYSSNTLIYAPSTLPSRLIGDSGDIDVSLRQMLFVSGNMSMQGSVNKSSINDLLGQLDAIEKLAERSDNSFNESKQNYEAIVSSNSFYTQGSSIEEFGTGFEAPLKSKTQINISLPISKQTTMPSSTSSFYYYDRQLERWSMKNPNHPANPQKIISEPEDNLGSYEVQLVANPLYRVVETAQGFDAVGRKVVSGSNTTSFAVFSNVTQQSDDAIGSIVNSDKASLAEAGSIFYNLKANEFREAHYRTYAKSIFDSSNYYPEDSQKINLSIDYPFLVEKVVVKFPLYINGNWFNDLTTCMRPFTDSTDIFSSYNMSGRFRGAVDFGGPGITFGLFCHRKAPGSSYLDLIASGTITNTLDNSKSVVLKKDPNMKHYSLRPVGFKSFSNPTTVISGTNNIFDDRVMLEMEASIAGGITCARLDRSYITSSYSSPSVVSTTLVNSNRRKAVSLLTSEELFSRGERPINAYDMRSGFYEPNYDDRSPRIYVQQVSPLSRGATGVQFNGNSILGGNVAYFNLEDRVINPLYVSASGSLPTAFKSIIDTSDFGFEAVSIYSTVDSRPSPYLLIPGDRLTLSISKTRPVIYRARTADTSGVIYNVFSSFDLTGSHGTVMLNTGSIDITIFGSYVRGGVGFNP
jgi:hypothetical protein